MNPLVDFALANLEAFANKYAGGDKVKALTFLGYPPVNAAPKETTDAAPSK